MTFMGFKFKHFSQSNLRFKNEENVEKYLESSGVQSSG